jgi:hypothetical protein
VALTIPADGVPEPEPVDSSDDENPKPQESSDDEEYVIQIGVVKKKKNREEEI